MHLLLSSQYLSHSICTSQFKNLWSNLFIFCSQWWQKQQIGKDGCYLASWRFCHRDDTGTASHHYEYAGACWGCSSGRMHGHISYTRKGAHFWKAKKDSVNLHKCHPLVWLRQYRTDKKQTCCVTGEWLWYASAGRFDWTLGGRTPRTQTAFHLDVWLLHAHAALSELRTFWGTADTKNDIF